MCRSHALAHWDGGSVSPVPRPRRELADIGGVEADGGPDVDRRQFAALDEPLHGARVDVEAECGFPCR